MKRFLSLLFKSALMVTVMALLCCHGHHNGWLAARAKEPFTILATTFPVYLLGANVCANAPGIRLELLVPATAGCPHGYSPTPRDLQKLAKADLVLINGFGLEDFLEKSLQELAASVTIVDAGKDVPTTNEGPGKVNPHIFAAPRQAAIMAGNIARELAARDQENAAIYESNAKSFGAKLDKLSARLSAIGDKAVNRGIALEHEALAYLAANANLDIVAMLEGPATAPVMARLEKALLETKPALLASDAQYSARSFRILSKETGLPLAMLDPCASGPDNPPLNYYEEVMEKNIKILEAYFGK